MKPSVESLANALPDACGCINAQLNCISALAKNAADGQAIIWAFESICAFLEAYNDNAGKQLLFPTMKENTLRAENLGTFCVCTKETLKQLGSMQQAGTGYCLAVAILNPFESRVTLEHRFVLVNDKHSTLCFQAYYRADLGVLLKPSVTECDISKAISDIATLTSVSGSAKVKAAAYASLCGATETNLRPVLATVDWRNTHLMFVAVGFQGCTDGVEEFIAQLRAPKNESHP